MIATIAAIGPGAARTGIETRTRMPETSIWNDYWHFDRLSSFDDAGQTNYREDIAAGWRSFFDSLPDGASILDLCTGNGAIAVMAAEAGRRRGKDFRIVAVDAADVNPYRYVTKHRDELAAIEFRPATPIENLPWPAASFDAVVSQYGIEYSDLSRSIPELARVVAPAGKARLFLHAAEGAVVQRSRQVIPEIDFLLYELDLAGKAQNCLRAVAAIERNMNPSASAQCAARESVDAFQKALQENGQRIATAVDREMLRDAGKMLAVLYQRRRQYDVAQAIGLVEEIRTEWRNHRGRLVAQIEAAVTRDERAELAGRLKRSGAREVKESDQMGSGGLIGHCLEASF
jgi:ubiquinone/menaquinone biosynthesis C-methylase UbiE